MKRYYTADYHLGHANIVKYCKRPTLRKSDINGEDKWVSPEVALEAAERHDKWMIRNTNGRIKPGDIVNHIGDFMNRGGCAGIEGLRNNPDYYIDQLNGTWVMIEGNHDKQNKVRSVGRYLITNIGPYNVFLAHYPLENFHRFEPELIEYVLKCTDFQICGHVHDAWAHKWIQVGNRKYLNINAGVDVRRYVPMDDSEVIVEYERAKREVGGK